MKYARYNKIYTCDLMNGEGVRLTIFLTGCSHGCDGCYNKSTWNPNSGIQFTDEIIDSVLEQCSRYDGLSLSGGDPLHRRNRATVLHIARKFRSLYPDKDIWMWTGYKFEDIKDDETVKQIFEIVDVVVDGKYEKNNPTQKPWRGSDNQRLHRLKQNSIDVLNID